MLCALVLGRSSEIIEEKVQLSIRTKSPTLSCCFSLKLAQSYSFFSFFVYFRAENNHLLQKIIHLFLQIVNIFLSIVRKPKRFLFCMFLFVVKWWEIPLEGSLVAGRWRTVIRDFNVQEPRTVVFRVKPNIWKSFPHPLWLSPRKVFGCLSWFVVDVKTLPSAFPRCDESHFTILKLDFDVFERFSIR